MFYRQIFKYISVFSMHMNYLVTGGAGFIGSHIAEALAEKGENVKIIDNLCEGSLRNLKDFKEKVEFVKGDIRDFDKLAEEFKNIDFISHQAALRSVPKSVQNPEEFNDVNINGHLNVLKAALKCKVKKVVFASSSSVYGDPEKFPEKESFMHDPKSPYALTKVCGEHYCRYFCEQYGLETVSLRYFNVFGPRQDPDSEYANVIPAFIKRLLQDEPVIIYGDGSQKRDYTHIRNVVEANMLMFQQKLDGSAFNVCDGISVSVNELADKLMGIMGKKIRPAYEKERQGDVRRTQGDPTKLRKLGFRTAVSFDEGLRDTVEWFKNTKTL